MITSWSFRYHWTRQLFSKSSPTNWGLAASQRVEACLTMAVSSWSPAASLYFSMWFFYSGPGLHAIARKTEMSWWFARRPGNVDWANRTRYCSSKTSSFNSCCFVFCHGFSFACHLCHFVQCKPVCLLNVCSFREHTAPVIVVPNSPDMASSYSDCYDAFSWFYFWGSITFNEAGYPLLNW